MFHTDFPTGAEYITSLLLHELSKMRSATDSSEELQLLGTSLSLLHQVSTCHGKCRGGDHILESLAGRSYNLGAAALALTHLGYYDESLSLVRSLGEIANLLALLCKQPGLYPKWVLATKSERLREFSPAAVREKIGDSEELPIPMDKDRYAELCESSAHVTPKTVPNSHNDEGKKFVGGIFQQQGLSKTLDQLVEVATAVALMVSSMVDRTDLFKTVKQALESYEPSS